MFTKSSLVAFVALALTFAITSDVFAGGKRPGTSRSRPIFGSSRSYLFVNPNSGYAYSNRCGGSNFVYAPAPTATAAVPGTYRSYSYDPSAPPPVYVAPAPAPSRTPSYMLPKTDPRRYSGGN